ncbi:urea ABC transporter permease subunit UrtC, partial [Coleofasciculus sp. FACHB-SPT36]|nr:urea ABC transporter permease subunit UrtC [Coleofasciculus sp. FACHB-SPT36]
GWLRYQGFQHLLTLLGRKQVATYPSLEEDPEVQHERENIRN